MKPGDLVEIAVVNGHFVLPNDRLTGIVLAVRDTNVESWCDGKTQTTSKKYADLLVASETLCEVPCSWLGVVSEAR